MSTESNDNNLLLGDTADLAGEVGVNDRVVNNQQQKQQQSNNTNSLSSASQFLFRRLKMVSDQNDKMFDSRKKAIVSDLTKPQYCDLSPKGSVDEGCQPLMKLLNDHDDYVTTSSCSGRISIFHMATKKKSVDSSNSEQNEKKDDENENTESLTKQKSVLSTGAKRGEPEVATGWVFVSHDRVADDDISILRSIADFKKKFNIDVKVDQEKWKQLQSASSSETVTSSTLPLSEDVLNSKYSHQLTFCVEPFVMHVSCRNEVAAQNLLQAAVQAGYRNSGAVLAGSELLSSSSSSSKKPKKNDDRACASSATNKDTTATAAAATSPLGSSKIAEPPAKITVAIRHTSSISVPLVFSTSSSSSSSSDSTGGESFVTTDYVSALVAKGNAMMRENEERIRRLESEVKKRLSLE